MNLSLLHIHKPRASFPPAPNPFCSLFVYSENGHNRSKSQNLDFHKRVDHSTAPPKFPKLKPMFSLETLSRTLPTWFSQKGISQISIHAYIHLGFLFFFSRLGFLKSHVLIHHLFWNYTWLTWSTCRWVCFLLFFFLRKLFSRETNIVWKMAGIWCWRWVLSNRW